jgi:hypothetical protein
MTQNEKELIGILSELLTRIENLEATAQFLLEMHCKQKKQKKPKKKLVDRFIEWLMR